MFNMQRSFFRPTYEDFRPFTETKETPESYLLLIHLPGFAREHVSAKFESLNRRVKVFGERSIGSNRWRRFSVVYPVPENCEASKLHRKFEGGIVTITVPKKVVSKPEEQELVKLPPPPHKLTPSHESKGPSGQATMAQKGKEVISQEPRSSKVEDKVEGTISVPPKATTGDSVARKDKKVQADEIVGSVLNSGGKKGVEMKERKEDIAKPKSSSNEVGKVLPEVKAQKGEEERKGMLAVAVSENGKRRGAEKKESKEDIEKTSEERKASESEVIPRKPTTRVEEDKEVKAQKGQEGKNENLAGSILENAKNTGAKKKESKEDIEKTSEVRKASEVTPPKPAAGLREKELSGQKGQEGLNEKPAGSVSGKGKIKGAEWKISNEDIEKTSEVRKASEVIPPKPTTRVEEEKEARTKNGQEGKNEKLAGSVLQNGENKGAKKENMKAIGSPPETAQKGKAPIAEANADEKGQEGKKEKLAGPISENGKNRGAENKETKNEVVGKTTSNAGKPSPSSSPSPIDLVAEEESKGERKESTKRQAKEDKFGNSMEGGKGLKDVINFSKGNKVIASASEAMTRMAKRFNEEDKQMMMCVGAAVLVTAVVGMCASITFRSLGRP